MTLAEAGAVTSAPISVFYQSNIKHFLELKHFGYVSERIGVEDCRSLTRISYPKTLVQQIRVVHYCRALKWLELHENIRTIGEWSFTKTLELETIVCHAMVAPSTSGTGWTEIKPGGTIYVPEGSTGYESGYWKSKFIDNGWTISYTL